MKGLIVPMNPKSIIIKSYTNPLIHQLVNELKEYPSIRFFDKKINGEETLVVKCFSNSCQKVDSDCTHFYGDYTFLYTCLSLLLSKLILENYETILVKRILHYNYFYYSVTQLKKIANITSYVLSPITPLENGHELLLYRKQLIITELLKNFHRQNYLYLDGFIDFRLQSYYEFIEEVIDCIIRLSLSHVISIEHLHFILKNMFDMN